MRMCAVVAAVILSTVSAGCSSSSPGSIFAPRAFNDVRPSASERVLHSFSGGSDGAYPAAPTIVVDGELYGTTGRGGGSACVNGCGTIFKVDMSGQESVLHAFKGGQDGAVPSGPLTYVNGKLYGTTLFGGGTRCRFAPRDYGCGTIFEMSLTGAERVLYRFPGGAKGAFPTDGLTYVNGVFYGEANGGVNAASCTGSNLDSCGSIFKISPSGRFSILYAFHGADGAFPRGGLLFFHGNFYGVTTGRSEKGGGTLFRVSPSGTESTVLYFRVDSSPSGLAAVNGVLYGAVASGGRFNCNEMGEGTCGIISRFDLSGSAHVVYQFKGQTDGGYPNKVIAVGGNLYGTTSIGGQGCANVYSTGCGTVFEVTPGGKETILYRFTGSDGSAPYSALNGVRGTLYGATEYGGGHNLGTIFQVTP